MLRKCEEGHVPAIMNDGVKYFQKLVGLHKLGFAYESSLGLSGLISAPTKDELKALKKPPVGHYQRHVLQLSVTALASFAERRCERAFFFDMKGMTSDERPAVMHARLVGQVSQIFPVFARYLHADSSHVDFAEMGRPHRGCDHLKHTCSRGCTCVSGPWKERSHKSIHQHIAG